MSDPNFLSEFDKETDKLHRWFFITDHIEPRTRQFTIQQGKHKSNNLLKRKHLVDSGNENKPMKLDSSVKAKNRDIKLMDKTIHSHSAVNI